MSVAAKFRTTDTVAASLSVNVSCDRLDQHGDRRLRENENIDASRWRPIVRPLADTCLFRQTQGIACCGVDRPRTNQHAPRLLRKRQDIGRRKWRPVDNRSGRLVRKAQIGRIPLTRCRIIGDGDRLKIIFGRSKKLAAARLVAQNKVINGRSVLDLTTCRPLGQSQGVRCSHMLRAVADSAFAERQRIGRSQMLRAMPLGAFVSVKVSLAA